MLAGILLGSTAAAAQGSPGAIEAWQKPFAAAAAKLGGSPAPSGPVWIAPQLGTAKEACTSCHLGIADARFLYARPPYRRHPGHHLADHPPQRFGCVVCHGGNPAGLTFAAAGHAAPADTARREQWRTYYGWQPPEVAGMLPQAVLPGRCSACHPGAKAPDGARPYEAARAVVADRRCAACHVLHDEPFRNVRRAVHLEHLGSKVGAAWVETYLRDPHAFRPGTAMPAYAYEKGEVAALAAWLLSFRDEKIPWATADPAADPAAVARGRARVVARGCRTCHDIPGIEDEGFLEQRKIGPPLARVGEKLDPEWIRHWLRDPDATRPGTGMPRFRFAKGEVDDITAFLCSLRRAGTAPPAPAPAGREEAATRARPLAAKYRCAACHVLPGPPLPAPAKIDLRGAGPAVLARWRHASTTDVEGAARPFHDGPGAPRLFAAGEAFAPVLTYLAGAADLGVAARVRRPAPARPPDFVPAGEAGRIVRQKRCLSCHRIRGSGGDIGPDLSYAGSKLDRAWIVRFLRKPEPIRPMNRARMPDLGITRAEAETVADWIVAELRSPAVDGTSLDLDLAFSFVGASKVKSPYGCIACHHIGEDGGAVGPDLNHAGSRLRPRWIYHWIKDPKRWKPGVRMPNFEMPDEDRLAITRFLSEQK